MLILFLAFGLMATVLVLRNQSNFINKAAEPDEEMAKGPVHNLKVLYIVLNPFEGTRNLAETYYSNRWRGLNHTQFENEIGNLNINYFKSLSKNKVNYQVARRIDINTFPAYTNGSPYTIDNYVNCINRVPLPNGNSCEIQKGMFDHEKFIAENRICEQASEVGADEIWLLTSPYITTWEAWMIGPTPGFSPNGGVYVTPACTKHYIIMNPVYDQYDSIGHIFGHRTEAVLREISTYWKAKPKQDYIENFLNRARYSYSYVEPVPEFKGPGCGNAHFPLNGRIPYDYSNKTKKRFNCVDWQNIPNFTGAVEKINCTAWGCQNSPWNAYWLGSLPNKSKTMDVRLKDGRVTKLARDWWKYILYPDATINFVNSTKPSTSAILEEPLDKPDTTIYE